MNSKIHSCLGSVLINLAQESVLFKRIYLLIKQKPANNFHQIQKILTGFIILLSTFSLLVHSYCFLNKIAYTQEIFTAKSIHLKPTYSTYR